MRIATVLVIALGIGAAVAAVAAAIDAESILVSGPLIGLTGIALAAMSYRARRSRTFSYALVGPTTFVFCAGLIAAMKWGPREASIPVAVILSLSAAVQLVLLKSAFLDVHRQTDQARLPIQFSFGWMLIVVALATLPMAVFRIAGGEWAIFAATVSYSSSVVAAVRAFRKANV